MGLGRFVLLAGDERHPTPPQPGEAGTLDAAALLAELVGEFSIVGGGFLGVVAVAAEEGVDGAAAAVEGVAEGGDGVAEAAEHDEGGFFAGLPGVAGGVAAGVLVGAGAAVGLHDEVVVVHGQAGVLRCWLQLPCHLQRGSSGG